MCVIRYDLGTHVIKLYEFYKLCGIDAIVFKFKSAVCNDFYKHFQLICVLNLVIALNYVLYCVFLFYLFGDTMCSSPNKNYLQLTIIDLWPVWLTLICMLDSTVHFIISFCSRCHALRVIGNIYLYLTNVSWFLINKLHMLHSRRLKCHQNIKIFGQ